MSKIPNQTKEYIKHLELCISVLERIEKDEILKRPTVAQMVSASREFLCDYREVIANSKRKREG
jgi:hypothetical protein